MPPALTHNNSVPRRDPLSTHALPLDAAAQLADDLAELAAQYRDRPHAAAATAALKLTSDLHRACELLADLAGATERRS